jgi:hypothetical protein
LRLVGSSDVTGCANRLSQAIKKLPGLKLELPGLDINRALLAVVGDADRHMAPGPGKGHTAIIAAGRLQALPPGSEKPFGCLDDLSGRTFGRFGNSKHGALLRSYVLVQIQAASAACDQNKTSAPPGNQQAIRLKIQGRSADTLRTGYRLPFTRTG